MAAVTTIAAGSWSTGSTVFSGGSGVGGVPTNADTVTITHAITQEAQAAPTVEVRAEQVESDA